MFIPHLEKAIILSSMNLDLVKEMKKVISYEMMNQILPIILELDKYTSSSTIENILTDFSLLLNEKLNEVSQTSNPVDTINHYARFHSNYFNEVFLNFEFIKKEG